MISLQQLKVSVPAISLLTLQWVTFANGHYAWPFVVVDGIVSGRWEYVRPSLSFSPIFEYDEDLAICGRNATVPLWEIKTLKVKAGSAVTFATSYAKTFGEEHLLKDSYDPKAYVYHDGPTTAWLSKAPGELNKYAGDSDWFKIAAYGATDGITWDVSDKKKVSLMYASCAHIEIDGPGGGIPGPLAKLPSVFDDKDPAIWLPAAMYYPLEPIEELKNWQGAGPKVWTG